VSWRVSLRHLTCDALHDIAGLKTGDINAGTNTPMTNSMDRGAARRAAPPILQNAFRPFFLGAAVLAALSVPLWVAEFSGLFGGAKMLGRDAHIHEMLYGFLPAIVCGFALTAIPNWTGGAPVAGRALGGLFLLWVIGRGFIFWPDNLIALALDLGFLLVLAGVAAREILNGKNWRNLPIVAMLSLLAATHFMFHNAAWASIAPRATLAVATTLIALIGGRIIPSFTRNWLASSKGAAQAGVMPSAWPQLDVLALAVLAISLVAWVIAPENTIAGTGLIIASLAHLGRLARWRGLETFSEPLVWSLHAGYVWLVIGTGMVGASILWPQAISVSAGLHALAAGMIGTMSLAVMTRVCLGHTGRARRAGPVTTSIYILIQLGAILRVGSAFFANDPVMLGLSAVLWAGAFALFVLVYAPILFAPRADKV
jgi:uncharacterized protein involved in response to NO